MPNAARLGDPVGHDFDFAACGGALGALLGAALGAASMESSTRGPGIAAIGVAAVFTGPLGALAAGVAVHRGRDLAIQEARQAGAWFGEKVGRAIGAWIGDHLGLSFKVPSGVIVVGDTAVEIEGRPTARACVDFAACARHPSTIPPAILEGSQSVHVGGSPAARVGDAGACGFTILEGAKTVVIGGVSKLCECAALWKKYREEAEALIAPHDEDHRARNRAISAAYARLYLENPNFTWAGLAAYASKQVGCAMDHARHAMSTGKKFLLGGTAALPIAPLPALGSAGYGAGAAGAAAYTYEMLGKGNRELFLDIYPLHRFYQEHGIDKMRACAGSRSPPIPREALLGFQAIADGELSRSLAEIARHEQLNVLQPLIYDDYLLRRILVANETGVPLTSPAKLVLSSECDEGPTSTFDEGRFGGEDHGLVPEVYNTSERMNWILKRAAPMYEDMVGTAQHRRDLEQIIRQAGP